MRCYRVSVRRRERIIYKGSILFFDVYVIVIDECVLLNVSVVIVCRINFCE